MFTNLVQWKDSSTTWVELKDMKEAYPVQVAEYSVQNHISLEPAFAWWTPQTWEQHALPVTISRLALRSTRR